jgi:hypothetical protein
LQHFARPGSAVVGGESKGGAHTASTASLSDEGDGDGLHGEGMAQRRGKRPLFSGEDGAHTGERGDGGEDGGGAARAPRKKRVRDNWTPEEDKLFFQIVEDNRTAPDQKVVRLLTARLAPRRTYQQVKGHLKNMRAAAKI